MKRIVLSATCGLLWLALTGCVLPFGARPTPTVEPHLSAAATAVAQAAPAPEMTPATPRPAATLPLPTATRQLPPTATYDPARAAWTILVYMDGDNNLEQAALLDVNEMEAAGASPDVNVVVQLDRRAGESTADGDWTPARRFRIRPDDDPGRINSEFLADLGEINMGDPAVLADFIAWGVTTYPANRYALFIWDHGAGWVGVAYDDSAGDDALTMPELDRALADGLAAAGRERIDVVAFDACLMGQLEVYAHLSEHVDYVVASEELTPALGWNYATALARLYADPGATGPQWAASLVVDFLDYYRRVEPNDFVTMSAVNMGAVGPLARAVDALAAVLAAEPARYASAVGDARGGAEMFARVYPEEAEFYAAVDLHHFATILAQRSPDETLRAAAATVIAAIEAAVITSGHGAGLEQSAGVAVYFPRRREFLKSGYAAQSSLLRWPAFLDSYYDQGLADIPPPEITLEADNTNPVGARQPAFMTLEIAGRDVDLVTLQAGRYEPDGRRRLFEFDNVIPRPALLPDGSLSREWRDGVHEDFFVWNTTVTFLADDVGNGDYVVMWPTGYESALFAVAGRHRRADAEQYVDAQLLFDHRTGRLDAIWAVQSDSSDAPAELFPAPGDEFQIYNLFLESDDRLRREPGARLFLSTAEALTFDWRPLPDGDYFFQFTAHNIAGERRLSSVDFVVANSPGREAVATYLDPFLGFQFDYPASWRAPIYDQDICNVDFNALCANAADGRTWLYITPFPDLSPDVDAATLKAQTLADFGAVDILLERSLTVDGNRGLLTAYGYDGAEGPQTGLFATFVHNGVGYLADIDGPAAAEADTVAAMTSLLDSWRFRPVQFGQPAGRWRIIDLDSFRVSRPVEFAYDEFNGWQRFATTDGRRFVALRSDGATNRESFAILAALIDDAAAGVAGFEAPTPYHFTLGERTWGRLDFSYDGPDGEPIWGFIMATVDGGQEIVGWAEAPAAEYNALESDVFLVMIADLVPTSP